MFFDNDDEQVEDFNSWYANLSEEEKAEMQRRADLKWTEMENHPLYRKAHEIVDIVASIIDSLPEDERDFHEPVRESAMMLAPKFAGAYDSDMWLLAMQNAAIMRYHAQYVATGTYGFNVEGDTEVDERYIELLRREMDEYKLLFNEWMKTVHAMPRDPEMDEDEWGVFRRG
jgi:hypothetical protein